MLVVLGVPFTYSRYSEIGFGHRIQTTYIGELAVASWHTMETPCVHYFLSGTYVILMVLQILLLLVVLGVPLANSRYSEIGAGPHIQQNKFYP